MTNDPQQTIATWSGRPIAELSRDELLVALEHAIRDLHQIPRWHAEQVAMDALCARTARAITSDTTRVH